MNRALTVWMISELRPANARLTVTQACGVTGAAGKQHLHRCNVLEILIGAFDRLAVRSGARANAQYADEQCARDTDADGNRQRIIGARACFGGGWGWLSRGGRLSRGGGRKSGREGW